MDLEAYQKGLLKMFLVNKLALISHLRNCGVDNFSFSG